MAILSDSQTKLKSVIPPGKHIRDIDCTPYTELLESERAEVPDTVAAILELVDNPIEMLLRAPHKFSRSHPLRVDIFIHDRNLNQIAEMFKDSPETPPIIVVEDNAGGVDRDDFSRLFRFGEAGELAEHGISAYGRGGKRARLKLGNFHVVITRRGDKQYYGYLAVKTGANTNWKVPLYESSRPTIPEGTTRVAVTDLLFPVTLGWIGQLRGQLQITYSDILCKGKAEVWLNGKPIDPQSLEGSIAWSGGTNIEPARIGFSYMVNIIDHEKGGGPAKAEAQIVKGYVTIGLLRRTTTGQEWGFDIICNGRLLQRYVKSELGFCSTEKGGWGVLPSQKVSMVRGVVHLSGPSKAMPWRSNKVEFDDEKLPPLRNAIVKTCKYWVDAGSKISRLGISKISGTLDHHFTREIRSMTRPPPSKYMPPTLVGAEEPHKVSFVTTKKVVEQSRRVFDLESNKDVNLKAKEVFEEAVRTEASMYQGRRASNEADYASLSKRDLTSRIRTKMGKAGIQIEELRDISKMEKKDAIKDLQNMIEGLSESEAKKLYKVALKIK